MSSLTNEQRKMIEEKKKAAQAKLMAKFSQRNTTQPAENNNQSSLLKTGFVISPSQNGKTIRINYNNNPQNTKTSNTIKAVRGTCELTSKDRFTVHVTYHQQLIDSFKTIPSKNYGKQTH